MKLPYIMDVVLQRLGNKATIYMPFKGKIISNASRRCIARNLSCGLVGLCTAIREHKATQQLSTIALGIIKGPVHSRLQPIPAACDSAPGRLRHLGAITLTTTTSSLVSCATCYCL